VQGNQPQEHEEDGSTDDTDDRRLENKEISHKSTKKMDPQMTQMTAD
jgi:hypothetical protein